MQVELRNQVAERVVQLGVGLAREEVIMKLKVGGERGSGSEELPWMASGKLKWL